MQSCCQQMTNLMVLQRSSIVLNAVTQVAIVVAERELATGQEECQPQQRLRTNEGYTTPRLGSQLRKRRSVADVYQKLGDIYFRAKGTYRMKYHAFKRLASMLQPPIYYNGIGKE